MLWQVREAREESQCRARLADAGLCPVGGIFGIAAQGPQLGPVNIQRPLEVIGLVLDDPCLPAGKFPFSRQAARLIEAQPDAFWADHHGLQAVQGEAAFEEGSSLHPHGAVPRIQDREKLERCPVPHGRSFGVDVELVLHDRELEGDAQLRGGKTYSGGFVHHPPHHINELIQFTGCNLAVKSGCLLPEHRVPGLDDGRQRSCRKDFLHGFLDARVTEGGRRRCVTHGEQPSGAEEAAAAAIG